MSAYRIHFDLAALREQLSRALGCRLEIDDVRELLQSVGYIEQSEGWLARDLRPFMLVMRPARRAVA